MRSRAEGRGRYLIKNTAIFALGNMATKLITFFLVPLYTNVLSTSEYGVVELINSICTVLSPIIILNIGESVMRFSLDKDADHDKIMSVGLVFFGISIILGVISFPVTRFFSLVSDYSVEIYIFLVSSSACTMFLCNLRGKEKLVMYSVGNIIHTLAVGGFNIWFLAGLHLGIKGYFLAFSLSNIITIIYAIISGNVFATIGNFTFSFSLANSMLKFSIVLIPNALMWWIINSSDRLMVSTMISVAANGVYAISYKLPTLLTTLSSIFNKAWSYSAIREEGASDEEDYNNKIFIGFSSIVMLFAIGMLTFIRPFLHLYVSSTYYEAWKYTPFLIIGCVYLSLATFMSTSYTVHKDTIGFLLSSSIGAILNIILNFILIPVVGVYGAAFATLVSYVAVFVFRLIHTRKYIRYRILNSEFIIGTVLMIISSCCMFIDGWWGRLIQIMILAFSLVLYSKMWLPMVKRLLKGIRKVER